MARDAARGAGGLRTGARGAVAGGLNGTALSCAAMGLSLLAPTSAGAVDLPQVEGVTAVPQVSGLTVNGRIDPLGIGGSDPVLGWQTTSARRAVTQDAYEVRVGSAPGREDVWSTGRVESDQQVDVAYDGPDLEPATRYFWQVRVWDDGGAMSDWSPQSWFETGLLKASDWGHAAWIGKPPVSYAAWTDYTTSYDFTLNKIAFGTYLRAADPNNGLMFQVNVGDTAGSVPLLRPHAKVNGQFSLLGEVDLRPFGFTRASLLQGTHSISFAISGTTVRTTIDDTLVDTRAVAAAPPSGRVGVRTYGSESVTLGNLRVVKADGTVLAAPTLTGANPFNAGTLSGGEVTFSGSIDALVNGPENDGPLLRTTFDTVPGKTVRSARVYASARGVYELSLNGDKVGDQFLAPGYTEYDKRILSQTYDVTDQVRTGENAFGAALGDGWWAGKVGLADKNGYGTDLSVVARVKVTYTDGTTQWVDTDGSTWSWATGPYVATDNQLGETYDAGGERPGWDRPGFDDSGWQPVVTQPSLTSRLSPQPDEPVRATQVLDTVAVTEPQPGVTVFDLGQNMVGVPRVRISGTAGETVKLRHAEVLNPDGTLYTANLRAAVATDYYTFAEDGTVTYEPTFTQHGFRYIEVTGLSEVPAAADVHGVVLGSDLRTTGSLTTSDPMLDQLTSNVSWGARGNFLSIPTDTPARDERLGWTGDINVFGPTASYLFDMRSFLGKWMTDVRDEQKADGRIPAVVPSSQGAFDASGPGWMDAIVSVPYALHRAYGDTSVVRDNWASMLEFYDFAAARIGSDNLGAYDETFFTTTDWLSLEDTSGASNEVKTTAIWADTVRMMAELAAEIGDPRAEELAARAAQVKRDFVAAYVNPDGTIDGGSQTGYAMALGMGLVEDPALQAKVGEQYVAKLARADYHLRTGFIGTPWLLPALSNIGRDDLAYTLLMQKDYPSWGYEIEKGATTIWERWNSIQPDGSFGPVDMNSFNHYAYGAVADWMHQNIAGIRIGEAGYRTSTIAPVPGGGLTSGGGEIDTVYGALASSWRTTAAGITLDVTVPVGTTSTVIVPATSGAEVTESGMPLDEALGVSSSSFDPDAQAVVVEVGSGTYSFASVEPVTLGNPTVDYDALTRTVQVAVPVTNNTAAAVEGRLVATVPSGWQPVAPSRPVTVSPGESEVVRLVVHVPYEASAGKVSLPLAFGAATTEAMISVAPFTVPPVEDTTDHVDFGESSSEAAHQVVGSPSSGTSVEAGLTRRYANNSNPGAFYSARVAVDPGQPFVLRARETWNSAGTKDYDVYVDDVLVKHVRVDRGEGGQGVTSYQFLVDQAKAIDNDGAVTVKYVYPATNGVRQYYDPSIADLWVIAAPDTTKPVVSAAPAGGANPGPRGWFTTPVEVRIDASDDRGEPLVEYQLDGGGWQAYTGVVEVPEGVHVIGYRATDAAGNLSEPGTLTVKLDTRAPEVTATVSATRALTLTATDDNPTTIEYQLDGGAWTDYAAAVQLGDAAQTVRYRATDVAGNTSPVGSTAVPAATTTPDASPTVPPTTPPVASPVATTVTVKVVRRRQVLGRAPRATVRFRIAPLSAAAGGLVTIKARSRVVKKVRLGSRGIVTYRLPRSARPGTYRVVARFAGTTDALPTRSRAITLRVVRPR